MIRRKLLIVQSHLQRDSYPSLVPTFRKEVYNMTPLHRFLSTALHANGTYITPKEKNKQWGANSAFRLGRTVERSPVVLPRTLVWIQGTSSILSAPAVATLTWGGAVQEMGLLWEEAPCCAWQGELLGSLTIVRSQHVQKSSIPTLNEVAILQIPF